MGGRLQTSVGKITIFTALRYVSNSVLGGLLPPMDLRSMCVCVCRCGQPTCVVNLWVFWTMCVRGFRCAVVSRVSHAMACNSLVHRSFPPTDSDHFLHVLLSVQGRGLGTRLGLHLALLKHNVGGAKTGSQHFVLLDCVLFGLLPNLVPIVEF